MTEKKFILDTDIGDDIDDAYALDLALKKNLPLLGVTTVFRWTEERARIAKKMIALSGKSMPVYFGLKGSWGVEGHCCQWTDDLAKEAYAPDNENGAEEDAVDFIINSAKKYKKNLTILAIGPLTNIAAAIEKDPRAMKEIGGVIMMGGDYANQYVEWNIHCDVAAAKKAFSSDIEITAFGCEVTSKFVVSDEEQNFMLHMKGDAYKEYLSELTNFWLVSKLPGWKICLHDVMVVRQAYENYCDLREIYVHLETGSEYLYGMTADTTKFDLVDKRGEKKIRIAVNPDFKEMIKNEMNVLGFKED